MAAECVAAQLRLLHLAQFNDGQSWHWKWVTACNHLRHYRQLVKPKQAERYWKIHPPEFLGGKAYNRLA
jgi:hypothetical protein